MLPITILYQAGHAPGPLSPLDALKLGIEVSGGAIALWGAYVAGRKFFEDRALTQRAAAIEARKPFAQKQQEVYLKLVDVTAIIATRYGKPEYDAATAQFWILFWGAVPIVADQQVAKAIDDFAEALDRPQDSVPLLNASMNLARACRASMGITWSANFDPYARPNEARARLSLKSIGLPG